MAEFKSQESKDGVDFGRWSTMHSKILTRRDLCR